jgi:hypothetical protein
MPIVNVGMYETHLDPRYMFENDEYEYYNSGMLNEEEKEYLHNQLDFNFNFDAYRKMIAKYTFQMLEEYFYNMRDILKVELCGDYEISSPVAYNYETDQIYFSVDIDESELVKILSQVIDDDKFWQWAKQYKSRSGFVSFMPWEKDEYIKAINGKDIERAVAMYITYIYETDEEYDGSTYGYNDVIEKIRYNHTLFEFVDGERILAITNKIWE